MTNPLRWDPALTKARSGRPIYRDPLRLALAVGAVMMMVGGFLPWAEGRIGFLPVRFGGLDGAANGVLISALGLILLVATRSEGVITAPSGGLRWAPMAVGVASVAIWLLGRQPAELAITAWQNDSGSGSLAAGYWLAGLSVLFVAGLGSFISLRHHEGETSSATSLLRLPRRSDLVSLGATFGAFAGLVVGAAAALSLFSPTTVGAPLLFFAGIGFVAGAYGGRRLGMLLRGTG